MKHIWNLNLHKNGLAFLNVTVGLYYHLHLDGKDFIDTMKSNWNVIWLGTSFTCLSEKHFLQDK